MPRPRGYACGVFFIFLIFTTHLFASNKLYSSTFSILPPKILIAFSLSTISSLASPLSAINNQEKLFIGNNHITNYVDSYYLVGDYELTVSNVVLYNNAEEAHTTHTYDGDGTVTVESATVGNSVNTNKVFYLYQNSQLSLSAKHTELISSPSILELISDIISSEVTATTSENGLISKYGAYKTKQN